MPNIRAAATKPIPNKPATIPVLRKTETVANSFPFLSDIENNLGQIHMIIP